MRLGLVEILLLYMCMLLLCRMKFRLSVLLLILTFACSNPDPRPAGIAAWEGKLILTDGVELPLYFETGGAAEVCELVFYNGRESISWTALPQGETFHARLEPYDSELRFRFDGSTVSGVWLVPEKGPDYQIAFTGQVSPKKFKGEELKALNGSWNVEFTEETGERFPAIGEFSFSGDTLLGTFRTETGDYRYLSGKAHGLDFYLSTFDGTHAYYFSGTLKADSIVNGHFYSGKHYNSTWKAYKSSDNKLRDPYSISYFEHTDAGIQIILPSGSGDRLILGTPDSPGPVYVLEIMGTWCPNCKDAAVYLQSLQERFEERGLRISGFCFERGNEEKARQRVRSYRARMQISYPLYYAGALSSSEVYKVFPTMRNFISYPTLILVDKFGKVRGVHAGFNGPATTAYKAFVKYTDSLVTEMLKE